MQLLTYPTPLLHKFAIFSKTKTFACIVSFLIGVVVISVYVHYYRELETAKLSLQVDSLKTVVIMKDAEYDKLSQHAVELDSAITTAKSNVNTITKWFPAYRRRQIDNSDTASQFIRDFIRN